MLLHLLSAPCATMGSGQDGDAPAHSLVCVGHTYVLQPWPHQHHTEMSALLTSLLPEQVHFINEDVSKSLILLWLSSEHPSSEESWTHGLGCLTLGLFI